MSPADVRRVARMFLRHRQLLTSEEADHALGVAAQVLTQALARLEAAVDADDAASCAEAAHSLKGNLLNLGLPQLAGEAQQVTEKARAGDLTGVREIGASLRELLGPLLAGRPA